MIAEGLPNGPEAPVSPESSHGAKGALLDINITDEMRLQFRRAKAPGVAALHSAKRKFNHYSHKFDAARYTLFPFVAEFGGLLGPHAHAFIAAAATYQERISEGAWLRSDCVRGWRQSISLALQEVISLTVLRTMTRAKQAGGQPAPTPQAYRLVKLLHPPMPVADNT